MKTEILNTSGWYECHYGSPLDILEEGTPKNAANRRSMETNLATGGTHWTKCTDYKAFQKIMRGGASAFTLDMMAKAKRLTVPSAVTRGLIKVNQRKQIVADAGDELDFDAWKRGDVDTAWRTTKKIIVEGTRRKSALLYVNASAHCGLKADDMEWRGAAIAVIARTLTAARWNTEIVVGGTTSSSFVSDRRQLAITFTAKPSTMPLSVERLALQTSAAWYRYNMFNAMACNGSNLEIDHHYGFPMGNVLPPYVHRMVERGYKLIQIPSGCLSVDKAQAAVNQALKDVT